MLTPVNQNAKSSPSTRSGFHSVSSTMDDLIAGTAVLVLGSALVRQAAHWSKSGSPSPREWLSDSGQRFHAAITAGASAWRSFDPPASPGTN